MSRLQTLLLRCKEKGKLKLGKTETLEKQLRAEKPGGPEIKEGKWLVESLPAPLMSMVRQFLSIKNQMLGLHKLRVHDLLLFGYRKVLKQLTQGCLDDVYISACELCKIQHNSTVTTKKTFPEMFLYRSVRAYHSWHVPFITLT